MSALDPLHQLKASLTTRWSALSPREQRSLSLLGWLLGGVLFWSLAIAPAWNTLRQSQQRLDDVMQQTLRMQSLQRQAQALQARQILSREQALRTLQSLTTTAGTSIQLTVQGEHVAVQLKAVPAHTLITWLNQARSQAQALPLEAHLTRGLSNGSAGTAGMPNTTAPTPATPVWDGKLLLKLPSAAQ